MELTMAGAIYSTYLRAAHEAYCIFHGPQYERCPYRSLPEPYCPHNGIVRRPGLLPMCDLYKHRSLYAGCCQALELCGKPCARAAEMGPGGVLCKSHKNHKPKPCHLLRIPPELRMVIYRHVFPKEVLPGSHHHFASNVKVAVLKLNRLIYSEASSVLYGEATFLATLQGNTLQYLCTTIEYQDDVLTQSMELPEYADRIRKVCVKVETAHDHFSEDLGLPCGDHSVFTQREVVRKFVDLLGGASRALQQMDVQYSLVPCGALRQEEALVSLFLAIAPLRDVQVCRTLESVDPPNTAFGFWQEAWEASNLSGDEYDQLQSACSKDWLRSAPPAVNKPATTPGQVDKIAALCASIGPKLRAVSKSKLRGCNHRWLCHYFGNCDIFWHLFRVAAEYADINLVEQIGAAVDGRWMYARQVHAEDLRGLGNTFPLPNIDRRIMREFAAADSTLLAYGPSPSSWTDLADIVGGIYNLQKVGTEVVEELLYVRFRKNGKEWVRLKTPGMMRELQFFKYLKESGM